MAVALVDKTNTIGASGEFPFGEVKDNPGNNTGTPLNKAVLEDYIQFFHKMFYESGLTYNDVPDNEYDGWQLFEALIITTGGGAWGEYEINDFDLSANTGNFYLGGGTGRIKYIKHGKTVTIDISINGANTSVSSLSELTIAIPEIIGVAKDTFVSMGHFLNDDSPTFNTPPDAGTLVTKIRVSEVDNRIHITPYWGSVFNFYTSGSDNVYLSGQITFEVE